MRQGGSVKVPSVKCNADVKSSEQNHESMFQEKRRVLMQGRDEKPKEVNSSLDVDTTSARDGSQPVEATNVLYRENVNMHELNDPRET